LQASEITQEQRQHHHLVHQENDSGDEPGANRGAPMHKWSLPGFGMSRFPRYFPAASLHEAP
jgi:hypothetical protein